MANLTYPGVYIEEFTPPAPIAGVGTSTAAFIGEAEAGPVYRPTKLTSWDRFVEVFGDRPVPRTFLWYAVRGFFENGGTVCYVVRVSPEGIDEAELLDRAQPTPNPVATLRAREPGPQRLSLRIAASTASASLPWAELTHATTNDTVVVVARGDGVRFRPGDEVEVGGTATAIEEVRAGQGTAGGDLLRLRDAVTANPGDAIRQPVDAATTALRLTGFSDAIAPEVGSVLTLSTATAELANAVVDGVDKLAPDASGAVAFRVTLAAPVGTALPATEVAVRRHQSLFRPSAVVSVEDANAVEVPQGHGTPFQPGDAVEGAKGTATVQAVHPGDPTDPNATDRLELDGPVADVGGSFLLVVAGSATLRVAGFVDAPGPAPGEILRLAPALYAVVDSVRPEFFQDRDASGALRTRITHRVTLRAPLPATLPADFGTRVEVVRFDASVLRNGVELGSYPGVGWDARHPASLLAELRSDPDRAVELADVHPASGPYPAGLPALGTHDLAPPAGGGGDLGLPHYRDALAAFARVDDVNLVSVPDAHRLRDQATALQQMVLAHCERLGDRFAVLDAHHGYADVLQDLPAHAAQLGEPRGFAALYYPWARVAPASGSQPILVPPSGHVCGVFARSDQRRGVFKAPANEVVNGVQGLQARHSDADHGVLNQRGVNVIRVFGGGRPIVWGARTTSTSTNWQYVNVRRLFIFIEESIAEGIRWAVFEPNTTGLWKRLSRVLTDFLTEQWRQGALFGDTAEQAFYVRIDEALNPPRQRKLGRLNIEIGLQPAYPAEFVVVRIGIWDGGSEVREA